MKYETVIGLEVHAQLNTDTKIFCSCSTKFGMPPNTNICPVCTGQPGVLPVLNKKVVEYAIKSALALECQIAPYSIFARKQYFYPDLPKNFQISQYELPFAEHGKILLDSGQQIGITRIHLEEDAGKLLHEIGSRSIDGSFVDYNRTGVPLTEIVSDPDMRTPEQAYEYLTSLKIILEYIEISDCNMEQGSLRCDANISLRPVGQKEFGTKVEMKNMNSFRGVQKALAYEIERQHGILEDNKKIVQETRLWDAKNEKTISMRTKEQAHDYRYFPEPDLLPLQINNNWINEIKSKMPELPRQKKTRFIDEYNLSDYDAGLVTAEKPLALFFESTLNSLKTSADEKSKTAKSVANWITVELLGKLNSSGKTISESPIKSDHLAELIVNINNNTISGKIAKIVFEEMFNTGKQPGIIIKEKNLVQITDETAIISIIEEVIKENPKIVEQYKSGKEKAIMFLIGMVMKKSKGKANPQIVTKKLKEKL
ncbi:Asp-tRNA(Asn)/Glu-tRNA(Gln) amidotransferase subunit GatB [bacterium]